MKCTAGSPQGVGAGRVSQEAAEEGPLLRFYHLPPAGALWRPCIFKHSVRQGQYRRAFNRHQERGTDAELFDRDDTRGKVCNFDNRRQLAV